MIRIQQQKSPRGIPEVIKRRLEQMQARRECLIYPTVTRLRPPDLLRYINSSTR